MSTPDYLWPARPEYLRRGTPALVSGWRDVIVCDEPEMRDRYSMRAACIDDGAREGPEPLWPAVRAVSIDLRDVTARAHAAMAYTFVEPPPCADVRVRVGGPYPFDETLARMRMLDESVTVAEARAALEWAESVVGDP